MNTSIIDPLELPSLSLLERYSLPSCCAIYFVLLGEQVLYVGRSINLAQRWLSHHRWNQLTQTYPTARIAWVECSDSELLPKLEAALIERFSPKLNGEPLEGLVAIRIFMPSELRDDFKTVCTIEKTTMNKAVVEFAKSYVEQKRALLPERSKVPSSLKELVRQRYFDLMNSGKIGHQRLKDLSFGQKPTEKELQVIKQVLGLSELPGS
jgi:hypothetical protein